MNAYTLMCGQLVDCFKLGHVRAQENFYHEYDLFTAALSLMDWHQIIGIRYRRAVQAIGGSGR